MTVEIRKRITGYAYPRNGNVHNPTPRVLWEAFKDGRLVDSSSKLKDLKIHYPGATVTNGDNEGIRELTADSDALPGLLLTPPYSDD